MIFISDEQIEQIYGCEENFFKWLMNVSKGCSFYRSSLYGKSGWCYSYDYDTSNHFSNDGYII